MRLIMLSLFTVMCVAGKSQQPLIVMPIDTTQESKEYWNQWVTELLDMGVEKKGDSMYINEEVVKLVKDSVYRNSIYPEKYNWSTVLQCMKSMELKKAFWHLINVYMTDTSMKAPVIGTLVLYDSLMEMDKMLLNAYYTYAFTDPRVCKIEKGKPVIEHPDLLEKHLNITKELINIVRYFRNERAKMKQ